MIERLVNSFLLLFFFLFQELFQQRGPNHLSFVGNCLSRLLLNSSGAAEEHFRTSLPAVAGQKRKAVAVIDRSQTEYIAPSEHLVEEDEQPRLVEASDIQADRIKRKKTIATPPLPSLLYVRVEKLPQSVTIKELRAIFHNVRIAAVSLCYQHITNLGAENGGNEITVYIRFESTNAVKLALSRHQLQLRHPTHNTPLCLNVYDVSRLEMFLAERLTLPLALDDSICVSKVVALLGARIECPSKLAPNQIDLLPTYSSFDPRDLTIQLRQLIDSPAIASVAAFSDEQLLVEHLALLKRRSLPKADFSHVLSIESDGSSPQYSPLMSPYLEIMNWARHISRANDDLSDVLVGLQHQQICHVNLVRKHDADSANSQAEAVRLLASSLSQQCLQWGRVFTILCEQLFVRESVVDEFLPYYPDGCLQLSE